VGYAEIIKNYNLMETTTQPIQPEKIALSSVLIFAGSILIQIAGISLWPLTNGFTIIWPTLAAIAAQLIGNFMFCRLLYKGVSLSFLIPLGSAAIPLVVSAIGFTLYGESVSILKVILLVGACSLIGFAGRMK
jgi:multidrug transporter EmrE-like cation transporter